MGCLAYVQRYLATCWHSLSRLKSSPHTNDHGYGRAAPRLHSIFDLATIGISTALPVGVYVISGQVVQDVAGPSAILSIMISAVAAVLSGLCYAELRSRVHRVQSGPYEYSYRVCGEATAYFIGWTLYLHYMMCTSATARAMSQNFDFMLGSKIRNLTIAHMGSIPSIDSYFDFVAFLLVLIFMVIVSVGVTIKNRWMTVVLNCVTGILVLFVLVVGLYHLDFKNWATVRQFFPRGAPGVFAGAAVFCYAFAHYDIMLKSSDFTTRAIRRPLIWSGLLTLVVLLLLFLGVASSVSLLSPSTSLEVALPEAFGVGGLDWVKYLICPAAVITLAPTGLQHFALATSQGFDLSDDGLVFSVLSRVSEVADTPLLAAVIPGVVGALLALTLPLTLLVQGAAFTLLLTQTACALVIIRLRYRPSLVTSPLHVHQKGKYLRRKQRATPPSQFSAGYGSASGSASTQEESPVRGAQAQSYVQLNGLTSPLHEVATNSSAPAEESSSDTDIDDVVEEYHDSIRVQAVSEGSPHRRPGDQPTEVTYRRASIATVVYLVCSICAGAILTHGSSFLGRGQPVVILLLVIFLLLWLTSVIVISRQPVDYIDAMFLVFQVPGLPWIPVLAIFINVVFLLLLPSVVWLFTFLWTLLGFVIYFLYGIRHSKEAHNTDYLPEEQRVLLPGMPSISLSPSRVAPLSTGTTAGGRVAPVGKIQPLPAFD